MQSQPPLKLSLNSANELLLTLSTDLELVFSAGGVPINKWANLGFFISGSTAALYIDGKETQLPPILGSLSFTESITVRIGGSPTGDNLDGFSNSFDLAFGEILPGFFISSNCVNPPDCDQPASECGLSQLWIGDSCQECNCDGGACLRLTDCRLNADVLCEIFSQVYACDGCSALSELKDGVCRCVANTDLDPALGRCVCKTGFIAENNSCIIKPCESYFKSDEISAEFAKDYTSVIIIFPEVVETRSESCANLILNLNEFGGSPECSWVTSRVL